MKKLKKPIILLMIFTIISSMLLPIAANASSVSDTRLNIRTSTKYKYMNNWAYPNNRNGIHLATVAEGKGSLHIVLNSVKIWVMTDSMKI